MRLSNPFLPVCPEDVAERGWDQPDFVYVTGDAYVDHPSFGLAIISRVLEKAGYKIAMLPQPEYHDCEAFKLFGRPRLGFLVTSGVIDSMVNHYTAAKKRRSEDAYSPGGRAGYRPDRADIVYCNRIREAYGNIPILIGGVEASLRRFAHYDYWDDRVRNSILVDSGADVLMYGMGERIILETVRALEDGVPFHAMRIPGTCVMSREVEPSYVTIESAEEVAADKKAYARAFKVQYDEQDPVRGRGICQKHGARYLIANPPAMPLTQKELDDTYALPYVRAWHPMYDSLGGIPALKEVEFSIAHVRGCYGACSFCALTFHQGRIVTARSHESVIAEAKKLTKLPGFKGYIHDVGGPTANFRYPACDKQVKYGVCPDRRCLAPKPCAQLKVDHSEYGELLRRVGAVKGVKKVFVRSGIRFDYLMYDPDDRFFRQLVKDHVSGQMKVAPEHICPGVLNQMGKPPVEVYEAFREKYFKITKEIGKEQYLVPYLMSSHPGSTLKDAVYLAEYLYKNHMRPEQVQDFYPTPGTVSTCMFYTGLDPYTLKPVFVEKTPEGKALQRALLQYYEPRNAEKVVKALKLTHREDLIPLLVPAEGRRAVQRSARRAEAADVTIHNDGTYTVRPQKGHNGKPAHGQSRAAAPAGRAPSPGARFAPHSAPAHKPKNNQQKENTTWKTSKKKK